MVELASSSTKTSIPPSSHPSLLPSSAPFSPFFKPLLGLRVPTLAAAFAFVRLRRDEASPWVRAWFIYLEVRQVSFMIPVIQIYIREVGLGFGIDEGKIKKYTVEKVEMK